MAKRGGELTEARKRMTLLPAGCKTLTTSFWTPIAVVENVYILPGIPSMVQAMLTCNEEHFVGVPIHRAIVRSLRFALNLGSRLLIPLPFVSQVTTMKLEGDIAAPLTAVQKAHPAVAIGSYVNLTKDETGVRDTSFNTRLTVEGRSEAEVEQVGVELAALFDGLRITSNAL
ncbi:hypothetical protein BBJ28_00021305 [Nothophytophthora sp. Chile5]|nr:hypothetical protein BBJ28_00021305 [Nothophytophthora sp. Chile5]